MGERHYRICPICEAGCGLELHADGRSIVGIEANRRDVFSTGHICAKGLALKDLDADPDRLRRPLIKVDGVHREASWSEAFEHINVHLHRIIETHGAAAVATYIGNPTAHNIGLAMGAGVFGRALRSYQVYSAGSVDQIPKQLACALMFGNGMAIPVPDITRTDYLLMLGANPIVSNGSLWMVPDFRGKLRALHARGGRLVTVDPKRTESARLADEHVFIRPGTDAWLLGALINELRRLGKTIPDRYPVNGARRLFDALAGISLERAVAVTGIAESRIVTLAAELARARCPIVYGRVGTTIQKHGTLTSFLIEVLNLLTGSLDTEGGAMFPNQPFHAPNARWEGLQYDRYRSRVSQFPEVLGQFPVAALAEEIETAGPGQIRALICLAGNPVVSNPDSDRLARAIESLDFVVCFDIYHTETSAMADVILPGSSPFEDSHYDQFLGSMGFKNAARYSPAVFATDRPDEWRVMLTLGFVLAERRVPTAEDLDAFEDQVVAGFVAAQCADPTSGLFEADVQEIMSLIEPERGVERMLDVGVRAGPYGDRFGKRDGLSLARMRDAVDGIDLGPIQAGRLEQVVLYPDGALQLAPEVILRELDTLAAAQPPDGLLLVGRRTTRSNNSWLRNLPSLGKGRPLCVLEMHPKDAQSIGVAEGDSVSVHSETARLEVTVRLTEDIAPGVVSMPHGFSASTELRQANLQTGDNYNRLVAAADVDAPSGTAALNGVPVRIAASQSRP